MHYESYEIITGKSAQVYEFVSSGANGDVAKLVIYSETNLHHFFNLGFGDKDELSGWVNDMAITNNGDSQKVLATVASTLYLFTDEFPDALVFATGSTKARTRLYRMGIANNLEAILEDFEIYGLIDEEWEEFRTGVDYGAFLTKRKWK